MTALTTIRALRAASAACLIFAINQGIPVVLAQTKAISANVPAALSYADYADIATLAPLVAKAQITNAIALSASQSTGVPTGFRRLYVEAHVIGLIRGDNGIPPSVSYLYDVPLDARGKVPKLKKRQVLLLARAGAQPGQIQLVTRDGQLDWTPAGESAVRAILSETLGANTPPRIIGVGDAFHVAGTIAGEGETQIFLKTDTGQPVSLSIVRRPGEQPRWAVALGEIVDEAAATPQRGTLLWYRLACALPAALPAISVRTLAVSDAEAARSDYAVVLAGLGPCGRTRAAG
ncbi:hypothetical protein BH10PSE12_BH10PSE12_30350 [soil metagenome]